MDDTQELMFSRIKQGDWSFDDDDWSHVSEDAKDLITSCLRTNPDARISAAAGLKCKWFNTNAEDLTSRDLSQSLLKIKEKRPRLKDLARAFMAIGVSTKNALKDMNPIQGEMGSHQLT